MHYFSWDEINSAIKLENSSLTRKTMVWMSCRYSTSWLAITLMDGNLYSRIISWNSNSPAALNQRPEIP